MLGIIGGTGLDRSTRLTDIEEVEVSTPYGPPASPLRMAQLDGQRVALILRHGVQHQFAPHRIPYRANLWALKCARVQGILAVATVGGIGLARGAGTLMVPDQVIDYTYGRDVTYFDDFSMGVRHVDMTHPFDEGLRQKLLNVAKVKGVDIEERGTYACTQGPRLETAAEVRRYANDGAHVIGMTLYPECALARELGIPYAALCVSVNHAAGVATSASGIDFSKLDAVVDRATQTALDIVSATVALVYAQDTQLKERF